jgi:hypothetical protein
VLGARVARVCLPSVPTQLRGDEPRRWSVAGRVTVPRAVGGSSRPSVAFFGIRGPASQTGTTRRPPEGHRRSSGTGRWRAGRDSHPRTATRPGVVHRPQRTGNVRDAADCRSSRVRLQPSAIPLLIVCDEVDFPGVMVLAKRTRHSPPRPGAHLARRTRATQCGSCCRLGPPVVARRHRARRSWGSQLLRRGHSG